MMKANASTENYCVIQHKHKDGTTVRIPIGYIMNAHKGNLKKALDALNLGEWHTLILEK